MLFQMHMLLFFFSVEHKNFLKNFAIQQFYFNKQCSDMFKNTHEIYKFYILDKDALSDAKIHY